MPAKNVYQYPLHNEGDYKGRIRFTLFAESYLNTGLSDVLSERKDKLAELKEKRKELEKKSSDQQLLNQVEKVTTTPDASIDLQIQEVTAEIKGFEGVRNVPEVGEKPRQIVDTEVMLYLPQGLQFRDNVTYENMDIGGVGAAVSKGAGIVSSMADGIGSFVDGLTGNAQMGDELAKLATVRAASMFGSFSDEITAGLKLQTGVTTNPNQRSLFKQVNMREFQFNFKMVARSKLEADQIKNIIQFFRSELYPEDIPVTIAGQEISLGYQFPNKFNIEFEYDGKTIAHKVKPCFLRSVDTTYNASQMAFHEDGEFLEVDMNLNFTETATLSKKDVLDVDADGVGY